MEREHIVAVAAGVSFEVVMLSARGGRPENQDNLLVQIPGWRWSMRDQRLCRTPAPGWPDNRIRLAVLDGMGGHGGGREAAEAATSELAALAPFTDRAAARAELRALHDRLLSLWSAGRSGATLTVIDLDLASRSGVLAHIGDSRGYRRCDGRWHQLTRDHRVAEFAYRDGELDRLAYENVVSSPTNEIAQALGFGSILAFDRRETGIRPSLRLDLAEDLGPGLAGHADVVEFGIRHGDDQLLLATDGILGVAPQGCDPMLGLLDALGPLDAMLWLSMVDLAARSHSEADNTTGLFLRLG